MAMIGELNETGSDREVLSATDQTYLKKYLRCVKGGPTTLSALLIT